MKRQCRVRRQNSMREGRAMKKIDCDRNVVLHQGDSFAVRHGHFRGYFYTVQEIKTLEDSQDGDYAYCVQAVHPYGTGNKWIYMASEAVWEDSGVPVPDQTVPPGDNVPSMAGKASAGNRQSMQGATMCIRKMQQKRIRQKCIPGKSLMRGICRKPLLMHAMCSRLGQRLCAVALQ